MIPVTDKASLAANFATLSDQILSSTSSPSSVLVAESKSLLTQLTSLSLSTAEPTADLTPADKIAALEKVTQTYLSALIHANDYTSVLSHFSANDSTTNIFTNYKAYAHYRLNDFPSAIATCTADDFFGLNIKAQSLHRLGMYDESEEIFKSLLLQLETKVNKKEGEEVWEVKSNMYAAIAGNIFVNGGDGVIDDKCVESMQRELTKDCEYDLLFNISNIFTALKNWNAALKAVDFTIDAYCRSISSKKVNGEIRIDAESYIMYTSKSYILIKLNRYSDALILLNLLVNHNTSDLPTKICVLTNQIYMNSLNLEPSPSSSTSSSTLQKKLAITVGLCTNRLTPALKKVIDKNYTASLLNPTTSNYMNAMNHLSDLKTIPSFKSNVDNILFEAELLCKTKKHVEALALLTLTIVAIEKNSSKKSMLSKESEREVVTMKMLKIQILLNSNANGDAIVCLKSLPDHLLWEFGAVRTVIDVFKAAGNNWYGELTKFYEPHLSITPTLKHHLRLIKGEELIANESYIEASKLFTSLLSENQLNDNIKKRCRAFVVICESYVDVGNAEKFVRELQSVNGAAESENIEAIEQEYDESSASDEQTESLTQIFSQNSLLSNTLSKTQRRSPEEIETRKAHRMNQRSKKRELHIAELIKLNKFSKKPVDPDRWLPKQRKGRYVKGGGGRFVSGGGQGSGHANAKSSLKLDAKQRMDDKESGVSTGRSTKYLETGGAGKRRGGRR